MCWKPFTGTGVALPSTTALNFSQEPTGILMLAPLRTPGSRRTRPLLKVRVAFGPSFTSNAREMSFLFVSSTRASGSSSHRFSSAPITAYMLIYASVF